MSAAVTVLLSIHNGAATLDATLESIVKQTYRDLELLVIDDGSTDGTAAALERWGDPRIRIVRQERSGLTLALRRGVELARGSLVARIDADDVARVDRLERQVALMNARPDVGLAGSWADVVDGLGRVVGRGRPPTDDAAIRAQLLWDNAFFHSSMIFRTDLVRRIGNYDGAVPLAQDYDLAWRVGRVATLANVPETLIRWRRRANAISVVRRHEQRALVASTSLRALSETLSPIDRERFGRLRRLWDGTSDRLEPGDGDFLADLVRLLPPDAARTTWVELIGLVAAARRGEAPGLLRAAWDALPAGRHRLVGPKTIGRILLGSTGIRAARALRRSARGY